MQARILWPPIRPQLNRLNCFGEVPDARKFIYTNVCVCVCQSVYLCKCKSRLRPVPGPETHYK